jgi:hypothetical protein
VPQRTRAALGRSSRDGLVEIPQKRFLLAHFGSPNPETNARIHCLASTVQGTREFSV